MKKFAALSLSLVLMLALFTGSASAAFKLMDYKNVGGDFTLTDQHGKKFVLSEQKKVVMLFFGYLSCPDVCPMALLEMKTVKKQLGKQADEVIFAYVTVDPDRDSQKILKSYLLNFDEEFIGLRGTQKEVDAVAALYKVIHRKRQQRSAMGYTVDHTAATYMVDKKGKLRYIFQEQTPSMNFVRGIKTLLQEK